MPGAIFFEPRTTCRRSTSSQSSGALTCSAIWLAVAQNGKPKTLMADLMLDKIILQDVVRRK